MAFDKAVNRLTNSDNLMNLAYILGGFVVTEQVTRRVGENFEGDLGQNIPDEAYGVVTAGAFYGYGSKVFNQSTANMMAMGSLVHTADELSNRVGVSAQNLTGDL